MKWFTLEGISQEIKKIRWPKKEELLNNTLVAIMFMLVFAVFFIFSDFIVTLLLRVLGVVK